MARRAETPARRCGEVRAQSRCRAGILPRRRTDAPLRRGADAGFSLIEMLVALSVFALAVLGLLNLAGESTRTAVAIEERVLAAVVADNVAVEAATLDVRSLADEASGSEEAGGIDWHWTRSTTPSADPSLLRVDIRVSPPGESRVAAEVALFRSLPR
ncbi:type II secretion system minor pseudopilin GspI [Luteimonas terricola]|uniref:Type II secretion system protein I n=1 Tax=Luteimonas terricola TaxID=645597 RepID=A0ABQ2EFK9_9GAMM|nr:type II secretion system minor pseudopilin GspI [Luteimonas terricola]GGK09754.1 type II secretion system protein GspI [Luteimonas terricola]